MRLPDDPSTQPRAVALEGASNLRDIGGWRGADGRRVWPGVVYRSASLARLTARDVETLAGLGLRTVDDLRGEAEAAIAPSILPAQAERIPCR